MKKFFILALLASAVGAQAAAPYYSIRSQSVNAARELVGWQQHINQFDKEEMYASLSFTPEYTRSFRPGSIARCIFSPHISSDCKCPSITVSGLYDTDETRRTRGDNEWMAENFGLPEDFKSKLTFSPRISNFNFDINFFLGLDEVTEGLFFRIHAPITWTKWELGFCETVENKGTLGYVPGYFNGQLVDGSPVAVPRANLLNSAAEFLVDGKAPTIEGVTFDPLRCCKLPGNCCKMTKTRLSDIEAVLGWNFAMDEDYHFGLGIRGSAPTGNKPECCMIFEPIVGSGGHWKLGGMLTSHYCFWRSDDEESSFGFWLDANIQHLFKTCQKRCFDLCGKPNSRYMLMQKLGDNTQNLQGDGTVSTYQFANVFSPVANKTCLQVKTSVAVEGDVVAKFAYMSGGFQVDLGYEFWGKSCEKICPVCCDPFGTEKWALKGDAFVYGFACSDRAEEYPYACDGFVPVALAATESKATINKGVANHTNALLNVDIDNGKLATALDANEAVVTGPDPAYPVNTSIQPVLLKDSDIGYSDAATKGMSHKVFTHLSYTWDREDDWMPFVGIGASAEFAHKDCCKSSCNDSCSTSCSTDSCNTSCNTNCCTTSCNTSCSTSSCCTDNCSTNCCTDSCKTCCPDCALSQWAVWVKGGITFN